MNKVLIQDVNLLLTVDKFSRRFARCKIMSLIDLFLEYNQITLYLDSRDFTAFSTSIGLVRSCTIVIGATNLVATFQRVIIKILKDYQLEIMPFIDNITSSGLKINYNREDLTKGVQRYVLEHIIQLNKVLADIERASGTVSRKKCYFLID